MKRFILTAVLALSTNAFAAQTMCGISVQEDNIIRMTETGWSSIAVKNLIIQADHARIRQCFSTQGAVLVGLFPNGEVRAYIF